MAASKTITISQQYTAANTSPSAVSFTSEPIVQDGVLTPSISNIRPGVFTAGTPNEGGSSNPTNDSNP